MSAAPGPWWGRTRKRAFRHGRIPSHPVRSLPILSSGPEPLSRHPLVGVHTMPIQLRAIDHGAILLVRPVGEADARDWSNLPDAASTAGAPHGCGLLIDLRRRPTLPSATAARSTVRAGPRDRAHRRRWRRPDRDVHGSRRGAGVDPGVGDRGSCTQKSGCKAAGSVNLDGTGSWARAGLAVDGRPGPIRTRWPAP